MKLVSTSVFVGSISAISLALGVSGSWELPTLAQGSDTDLPGAGIEVNPGYTTIGELFQTEVVNIGLERLGYEVEPSTQLENVTMHVAISNGDLDFTASHWEIIHSAFYENNDGGEAMQRVGVLVEDCAGGYLIDKATATEYNITSLDQFQDPELAALFDTDGNGQADLTGCNSGWGCEVVIEHHLDVYELRDSIEHNQGKYDALIANTITNYRQGNPIFYFAWTPYWVGGVLRPGEEVVWLSVPYTDLPEDLGEKTEADTTAFGVNLGFAVDRQRVVANTEFLENNPAAAEFFEQATIPIEDINAQNLLLQEGEDSEEDIRQHAESWISDNQEQFDAWIETAIAAAK